MKLKVIGKLYNVSDFFLMQKNGKDTGKTQPHLHFHMIPSLDNFEKTMTHALSYRDKISDVELTECTQQLKDAFE